MRSTKNENYYNAISVLPTRIKNVLESIPKEIILQTDEIRVRAERPITLTISGKPYFADGIGGVTQKASINSVCPCSEEMDYILQMCCNSSVYSHTEELKNGFITLKSGCRVGVCGDFSGEIPKNISSFNIRLSRQIIGVADDVVTKFNGGMLIVGKAGCGKTTVLRDLIRSLSNGKNGKYYKVAVVDSRYEIGAAFNGTPINDLGLNTDILSGTDKSRGIEMALRTLFPDVIAFDEIGTIEELNSVMHSFNAGSIILTTAHAGNLQDINRRKVTRNLLLSGAIDTVVLLPHNHNGDKQIMSSREVLKCGL